MKIGVLSMQGDVQENVDALCKVTGDSCSVHTVKTPAEIDVVDGLVIPGGESTMIGQLSLVNGALKKIHDKIATGMPTLGICAGLVLLSGNVKDRVVGKTDQPLLDLLDVQIERNSFGRQRDSFECDITIEPCGISNFNGVFIRAPSISDVGPKVNILAKLDDKIIAVQQDNMIGTAFHPELSDDTSLHEYFVDVVKNNTRI